jgi:hypothetical protein
MRDREFDLGVRQEERIANTARAAELRKQEGAREKLNEELNTLWGEARAGKLPTRLQASPFATIGPERRRPGMLADAGPTLKAVAAKQEQAARLSKEGKGGGAGTLTERQVEEWNNLLFSGAFGQGGAGVRGMMERSLQLGAEGYSSLDEEGAQEELGRTLADLEVCGSVHPRQPGCPLRSAGSRGIPLLAPSAAWNRPIVGDRDRNSLAGRRWRISVARGRGPSWRSEVAPCPRRTLPAGSRRRRAVRRR